MQDTLNEKIGMRAGRIQLIVAAVSNLAYVLERWDDPDFPILLEKAQDQLSELAGEYGRNWLDECSDLLKNLYNRRCGP